MKLRIISMRIKTAAVAALFTLFSQFSCQEATPVVSDGGVEMTSGDGETHQPDTLSMVSQAPPMVTASQPASQPAAGVARVNTSPDLIVTNAKVWTGNPNAPAAEAFAVANGEFVAVGNNADILKLQVLKTIVVDARGRRVIPGLIDAHLHLISGGQQLSRLNLREVKDRKEFVQAVRDYTSSLKPGEWVLGGRWSTESWADPAQPTRQWIDAATGETPALLERMDGHGALANSAALKLAGIDAKGPADPPGGRIERDPDSREPTGILKEGAIDLVRKHVPPASMDQLRAALAMSMREANRFGITCVHTMSNWSDVAVLDTARSANGLTLRVRVYVMEDDWLPFIDKAKQHKADDWVRVAGFKQFADGSLGSRTAYMTEPFADTPGNRGLPQPVISPPSKLAEMCISAGSVYFGSAVHAIGDAANHEVLDVYQQNQPKFDATCRDAHDGPRGTCRIEHVQHLLPADIARFGKIGVIASMQPLHKADDGRYAEVAIGKERCKSSYAFRSLLDAGAILAFGSDFPVVTLDPFKGMHAAVTGKTLDGKVFVPEQNIKIEEALTAYTRGAAAASGESPILGVIQVGALADFAILNDDILSMKPDDLPNTWVAYTYVGGKQVWPGTGEFRE